HDEARAHYLEEGTPLRRSGISVDLAAAFWQPRRVTSTVADLRAAYDAQLRGEAEVAMAPWWDSAGPLWRAVFDGRAFFTYEDLSGHDVPAVLADTLAFLDDHPEVGSAEWKTRGHDDVPGLHELLVAAGFEPDESETVMVGETADLAATVLSPLPEGVVVRRVDDDPDRARLLVEVSALQAEVFGRHLAGESLLDRVDRSDGAMQVWAAGTEHGLVSTGRLELVAGTDFAGLWGGATLAPWRGRGIYRALTAARSRSALEQGARWMHSDCTEMSRPILERAGLVAVTTSTPYVWTRPV
uniref:hypothetical protein n=1 Tax=Nocardioides sp. TaxID=35761 RepID=UPI002B27B853